MLHTSPGMLNEAYGLLALDNSERPYIRNVPSHWPCASFRAAGQTHETVLWMRCPTRHDADCATARRQINQTMAIAPRGRPLQFAAREHNTDLRVRRWRNCMMCNTVRVRWRLRCCVLAVAPSRARGRFVCRLCVKIPLVGALRPTVRVYEAWC